MKLDAIDVKLEDDRLRRSYPPDFARELRQAHGLTQQDIANALGVNRAAVCRWELGERTPRRGELARGYFAILRHLQTAKV